MTSIDDAIFLMDDEVRCSTISKPIKSNTKNMEKNISKTLPRDTIEIINIAKSPPIDIIKPLKQKIIKKEEFVPSSPYTV
jgi:hypothetical protein